MREMIKNQDDMGIDLQKLLLAYLRKWWLLVLCTAVGAAAALLITMQYITPLYQASVTIYVNNSSAGERVEYISGTNLSTAQQLVNTYVNIIRSNTVLEKVIEQSGLDYTADEIRSCMSASQVSQTEMFKVYILHEDPEMAAQLANAVADVAPEEIEKFVEGSSTKIIDYAKVPTSKYSPNYSRNIMMGALLGMIVAVGYVTLCFLLNDRINEEDDLAMMFDLPVLGRIPKFDQMNNKKSGYQNTYASSPAPKTAKQRS